MEPLNQAGIGNILLRLCTAEDFELLRPHLARTHLETGHSLVKRNTPIETVYFPQGGVASIVAEREGGESVEVALFGYDGMSGSAIVLGADQSPQASMIQVNGSPALKIASGHLVRACDASVSLRKLMLRFVQALNVQSASTAAANAHFALPERLARWLLMCHDRIDGDQLELTHNFMSMMLAVRRSSVTVTLHTLEGTKAIRGTRGTITILDRERLEDIAGDSYGEAEEEYRRLIGPFGKGRAGLRSVA
jgi:CRP-like cAMP-binding protein